MNPKTKEEIISKIIELELEITLAILNGHKPYIHDKFQDKRHELNTLRCLVFGYESKLCKKNL